jgi:hypothetical protein
MAGGSGGLAREGEKLRESSPPAKTSAFISGHCPPLRLLPNLCVLRRLPSTHMRDQWRWRVVSVAAVLFPDGFLSIPSPWICFNKAPLRRPRVLRGARRLLPSSSVGEVLRLMFLGWICFLSVQICFLCCVGSSCTSCATSLLRRPPKVKSTPNPWSLFMAMMLGFVILVVVQCLFLFS